MATFSLSQFMVLVVTLQVVIVHMNPVPHQQSADMVIYEGPQHQDPALGQAFSNEEEEIDDDSSEMALRFLENLLRVKQSTNQDEVWDSMWKNGAKAKKPPRKKTQMCHFKICNMRGKRRR